MGDNHKIFVGKYLKGGSHVPFQGSVMVFANLTPRKPQKVTFPVLIT
jgi:hypothetical protein